MTRHRFDGFSFAAGVGLLAALLPSYAAALVRTSARIGLVRHRGNDPLCAPQRISHEEIEPVRIEAIDTSSPAKTRYRISFENGRTKWYAARRRFAVRSTPDLERNQSLLEGKALLAHQA